MDMDKDELKKRIAKVTWGEVQTLIMADRGVYAVSEVLQEAKESEFMEFATAEQDVMLLTRSDGDALAENAILSALSALTATHHLIFVDCLSLNTTEISQFLKKVLALGLLAKSKVFLLDLSQLEYMTLRERLAGKIDL